MAEEVLPLKNLHLLPLNLPREGFHHFICSWLYLSPELVVLVDPGPTATIPALLKALKEKNVGRLDVILLTHVHLDHSGGTGLLLRHYPDARVFCHLKAIPHLAKPEKLWEASLKVLGDVADLYGPPVPVPERNLFAQERIETGDGSLSVFETPGHAPHHLSFLMKDILFIGEAAGIFYPLESNVYIRIAAPPGFNHGDYQRSLESLAALDVSHLCFSHYGYSKEVRALLAIALRQTGIWVSVIERHRRKTGENFEQSVMEDLLNEDPGMAFYDVLPGDIKARERFFLGNSFKGMRLSLFNR
jgi:glyoxylase-like metal-dependent hydrolase (beta-lactamase superfamily II)